MDEPEAGVCTRKCATVAIGLMTYIYDNWWKVAGVIRNYFGEDLKRSMDFTVPFTKCLHKLQRSILAMESELSKSSYFGSPSEKDLYVDRKKAL